MEPPSSPGGGGGDHDVVPIWRDITPLLPSSLLKPTSAGSSPAGGGAVMTSPHASGSAKEPKLLDRVRRALRVRHMSLRTEKAYVHWTRTTSSSTASATRPRWPKPRSTPSSPTWRSEGRSAPRRSPRPSAPCSSFTAPSSRATWASSKAWSGRRRNRAAGGAHPRGGQAHSRSARRASIAFSVTLLYGTGLRLMEAFACGSRTWTSPRTRSPSATARAPRTA